MRATPGGTITTSLVNGSQVTVIDGPIEYNGYQWWNIQTATGLTGWSVESVTDDRGETLRTLLPLFN